MHLIFTGEKGLTLKWKNLTTTRKNQIKVFTEAHSQSWFLYQSGQGGK